MQKGKKTRRIQKFQAQKKELRQKAQTPIKAEPPRTYLQFSWINYAIFGFGIVLLILGYYYLAIPASEQEMNPAEEMSLIGYIENTLNFIGNKLLAFFDIFLDLSSGPQRSESALSLNMAPILLVVAYLIVFPLAILIKKGKKSATESHQ
ncbi:hypothetical protein JXJ21_05300 [candidate division KSB1 bacterium]|nr:hypothetical protein [candidate division KSB1 bacterium]